MLRYNEYVVPVPPLGHPLKKYCPFLREKVCCNLKYACAVAVPLTVTLPSALSVKVIPLSVLVVSEYG